MAAGDRGCHRETVAGPRAATGSGDDDTAASGRGAGNSADRRSGRAPQDEVRGEADPGHGAEAAAPGEADPGGAPAEPGTAAERAPGGRGARPVWADLVALAALIGFAVFGIGSPLLGHKVFAGTDMLALTSPYREAGLAGVVPANDYLNDTVDALIPNTLLFVSALWRGDFAVWNPYILGGVPLGASPNYALFSPLTLPYYVMPGWLAPGYVKLLEIAVAAGGGFLYLRRIRLGRSAALLGGLVFASSGFMIAWTNWPQTRVAAFVPALFWAVERLVQRRRATDVALLAAVVAAMLFGGFPAITGYALLTCGGYAVVRVLAEYAGHWRRVFGVLAAAAAGVAAGVLLAAVQLLPFASTMSAALVYGRRQGPGNHLPAESLLTAIAPWAFGGTNPRRTPYWYLPVNLVEALSYVGAAALVLLLVGVAMPRAARSVVPRGVWTFLVVSGAAWVLVIYVGRAPLGLLQELPGLFAANYVGRARSVLGFLAAALAAVGFEALRHSGPLRRRRRAAVPGGRGGSADDAPGSGGLPSRPGRRGRIWYGVAVWAAAAVGVAALWWRARRVAGSPVPGSPGDLAERVAHLDRQVVAGLGFAAAALLAVALARWSPGRRTRYAVLAVVPVLVALQALTVTTPYWPRSDRATFYPVTDVHRYLAGHLGHDRFAGAGAGMYLGADAPHRLRALTGHAFLDRRFAEVVDGLPGRQFGDPPTYLNFPPSHRVATSPVLDRLGVRYFVVAPAKAGFGDWRQPPSDGSTVTLSPGDPVTVPVPVPGPLRGVAVTPVAPLPPVGAATRVEVELRDSSGNVLASSRRYAYGLMAGTPFVMPLAAEGVAPGTFTQVVIRVRSDRPLLVRGNQGAPVVAAIAPVDDGLRLAYAGSSVAYERTRTLPRIRWASQTVVEPDPRRRVARIAAGELSADEVMLDRPGAAAAGRPADLRVIQDDTDGITVRLAAQGSGYLVVADALQRDWSATVDGRRAELVPADHGLVAVAVPAGNHTVRLAYRAPYHGLGTWLSGLAAVGLLLTVGVAGWRRRRTGTG